jgi:uncharacterized protein YqgV (UPF0045/DUF77 family)
MTKVIEVAADATFIVGESGIKLTTNDKTVIEFYQGDSFKLVNKSGTPYIEYKLAGSEISVKIESKKDLTELLNRLEHNSEYRTETRSLMDALAAPDKDVSTESLINAFASIQESQSARINKQLSFTKRVARLSVEDKIKLLKDIKPSFKESSELVLTVIEDASDPDLGSISDNDVQEMPGGVQGIIGGEELADKEMSAHASDDNSNVRTDPVDDPSK